MALKHKAVTKFNKEILAIPVKAKDAQHFENDSSIHNAANNGYKEIVQFLLQAGANINSVDQHKWTPLLYAADMGHIEIVEILLKAGANVNDVDRCKDTPLHHAAAKGHTKIVEILLKAGANVNAVDAYRCTPLHDAVAKGHTEIVEILLKAGACANAVDLENYTPIHKAVANGHDEIAGIIFKTGSSTNAVNGKTCAPMYTSTSIMHEDIVKLLLNAGANVNTKSGEKMTPLHIAAVVGNKKITHILLDAEADCNARCIDGNTPLYYSDRYGHTEVSQYLREHEASKGFGAWQRLTKNNNSTFSTRKLSLTQTTKIVHVRRKSTGTASRQTDSKETTVVSSGSWDIQGGGINDQAFNQDPAHSERSDSTTPCMSEGRGNDFSFIIDSQQSAASDQPTGLSLQDGEDIRQQVADHWAKFSLQHKGQQGHCSTDVTSVVKEGNIALIQSNVNININHTTTNNHNYQQEYLQITNADIVNMAGTVKVVHREDVHSDNETEEVDTEC